MLVSLVLLELAQQHPQKVGSFSHPRKEANQEGSVQDVHNYQSVGSWQKQIDIFPGMPMDIDEKTKPGILGPIRAYG